MGRLIDLTGMVFGQLTVLERVKVAGEHESNWKCKCTCGKEIVAIAGNLKKGQTQSCGCTAHERRAEKRVINLEGRKFGRLTVLYKNQRSFSSRVSWHCLCECGNECDVDANNLTSMHTTSCGCIRTSYGETRIIEILNDNCIYYLYNKGYFSDLLSSDGNLLRYDFILFDDCNIPNRVIEFDGTQHNTPNDFFGGKEKFLKQQENDILKNQYAKSHNIPLVRIPYSKRNNINLEDILGDKYLI